jgi:hypothetical protein
MPLTVVWYERPVGSAHWSAITETTCWGHGSEQCGGYSSEYDDLLFVTRFLAADDECFTDLEYKAELYIGGSLAGSLSLKPQDDYITTNLAPALAKSMNVGICTPSTWHLQPPLKVTLPVYGTAATVSGTLSTSEMSYANASHTEGVYLFRLYPPRNAPDGAPISMPALVKEGQDYAMNVLRGHGLPNNLTVRGNPLSVSVWGTAVTDMVATAYVSPTNGSDAYVGAAVLDLGLAASGAPAQDTAISRDSVGDYAVVVAVVFAPAGSRFWTADHSLGLQIFSSWSLLDYG